ncbi:11239_t:CDS:2, partial [Paraglomus brasilianum]
MGCRLNGNEKRWLKNLIEEKSITLYPYSRFEVQNSCRTIKESSHMVVLEEILESHDIAREHFYNSEEFANEVAIHQKANHSNIIRFFGITEDLNRKFIVLEHVDGSLFKYLKEHSNKLSWKRKNQLALDITKGLEYLHSMKVLHKNLTSNNIHVHDGTAKISAVGLSRLIPQSTNSPRYTDVMYCEPNFKHNKESDVYSLGVLFWEISGGRLSSNFALQLEPVAGTPDDYVKLYRECCDRDPIKRPSCKEIRNILEISLMLKGNDPMKIGNDDELLELPEEQPYTEHLLEIINNQATVGALEIHSFNWVMNWLANNNYIVENVLNALMSH